MRMHGDPARGVVNADGRVHGVDNLFVAGGSTFTTGGFANPTLTIVALASRLAAFLDRHLRGAGRPSGSSSGRDPSSR
jgi:choline dehydrogenase-like flavoprotein